MLHPSIESSFTRVDRLTDRELGDLALSVVNLHRHDVHEAFTASELEVEFPSFASELGERSVFLADATENDARTFKWRGGIVSSYRAVADGANILFAGSAGNHASGVVVAGRTLGVPVDITVPTTAPPEKSDRLLTLAGTNPVKVHRAGATFDDTMLEMRRNGKAYRPELIPAFDSRLTSAGQGTLFDDIIHAHPDVEQIVVNAGGGGEATGVLMRRDQLGYTDQVNVVIAQATGSDSLSRSLAANRLVNATAPNKRYGGICVRRIGDYNFEQIARASNKTILTVEESAIDHLIDGYEYDWENLLRQGLPQLEPTSLVAIASLRQVPPIDGKTVVVATGRNAPLRPARSIHSLNIWNGGRLTNYF